MVEKGFTGDSVAAEAEEEEVGEIQDEKKH